MKLLYKILFEVKILHEYYLTNPDNTSVFQDATQTERLAWLASRYEADQPAISPDVTFALPSSMIKPFKNQGLVLVNSYSGFFVGVQVTESAPSGATQTWAPAITLANDFNILVLIQQQEGQFGQLTNGRMQRPVPSLYYFSNEAVGSPKTAPALSTAISTQSTAYAYEQGELSAVGSDIYTCYYTGTTPTFPPVPGNGFVNENDRMIVGTQMAYTFNPTDNVTEAQFTLKDNTGATVRTVSATGTALLDTVALNFNDNIPASAPPLVTLPTARASDPLLYSLEVTGNGGYTKTINLIFYDRPAELLSTWGIVQIQVAVSNSGFNLLDANGNLITPVLPAPDATTSPYPVFEIRCKSRYTFWRYYSNDPTQSLNAPPATDSFLQADGQAVMTKAPVPDTYLPFFFSTNPEAPTPSFTFLPNPDPGIPLELTGNQLFSNIWVPESSIFPTTPIST